MLTLHYIDESMLKFPVSKIAAASVLLAINIFKLREKFIQKFSKKSNKIIKKKDGEEFFQHAQDAEDDQVIFHLNTDIWNNSEMALQTGYTIEMLKEPLHALSKFVSQNLVPNKLKYFHVEAVQELMNAPNILNPQE